MTRPKAVFPIRSGGLIVLLVLLLHVPLHAQERTVGLLLNTEDAWEGYTLFAPLRSTTTYLIDMEGRLVHSWPGEATPGLIAYLLPGGRLLRTELQRNLSFRMGGGGGHIVLRDWEGDILWDFLYSNSEHHQHHDIEVLPNGNILMIAWERKSREECIAAGVAENRVPADGLYPDHIIEVRPDQQGGGTIVWEWHLWDHLVQDVDSTKANYGVVEEHPELIDVNAALTGTDVRQPDWWHTNSVDYNAELDQILLSVRNYSEIWIIDHGTTTAEAAGHSGGRRGRGGDLLYRYGNIRNYHSGAQVFRQLYVQHDAHWIADGLPGAGNILIFSNGDQTMGEFSAVLEITPPLENDGTYRLGTGGVFGPETPAWSYTAPDPHDFFAHNISRSQRLPNGNTLICYGPFGEFFEVTPDGETVWRYLNPVTHDGPMQQGDEPTGSSLSTDNNVFRCYRFPADSPHLQGRDLTPGDYIERYPTAVGERLSRPSGLTLASNYPNPFTTATTVRFTTSETQPVLLDVADALGRRVAVLTDARMEAGTHLVRWEPGLLPAGVYVLRLQTPSTRVSRPILLRR